MRAPAAFALCLLVSLPSGLAVDAAADPLLYDLTVPGSGAWGLKVTTGATGRYSVEIASNYLGGPYPGHVDNFGMWLYDEGKVFQFGIAIGGGVSQDRQILELGAGGLDSGPPAGVTVTLHDEPLDAGSIRFDIVTATPFATRYVVAWGAGMHEARFRVWGPDDTLVAVNTGAAYAIGDPELADGGPNVQVQKSYGQFKFVGAKAMAKTSTTVQTQHGAYGLWSSNSFKQVCPTGFSTPTCQRIDTFVLCQRLGLTDLPCDSASLSWSGPNGAGASGRRGYALTDHLPPGAYTFTVDAKVDAYGPWGTFGPAWMGLGEDASALGLADVALP